MLRSSVYLLHSYSRIPIVVVFLNTARTMRSRSSVLQRQQSFMPGRFFFMPMDSVHTSRAPSSSKALTAKPMASGVISSRLHASSITVSRPLSSASASHGSICSAPCSAAGPLHSPSIALMQFA